VERKSVRKKLNQENETSTTENPPADHAAGCVLTINAGSSSIKFALYQTDELLKRRLHGKVERIGLSETNLTFHDQASNQGDSRCLAADDHKSAGWNSSELN
jgi:hypothetical protein